MRDASRRLLEAELGRASRNLDTASAALEAIRDAHARWARCEITGTEFGDAIATALEAAP